MPGPGPEKKKFYRGWFSLTQDDLEKARGFAARERVSWGEVWYALRNPFKYGAKVKVEELGVEYILSRLETGATPEDVSRVIAEVIVNAREETKRRAKIKQIIIGGLAFLAIPTAIGGIATQGMIGLPYALATGTVELVVAGLGARVAVGIKEGIDDYKRKKVASVALPTQSPILPPPVDKEELPEDIPGGRSTLTREECDEAARELELDSEVLQYMDSLSVSALRESKPVVERLCTEGEIRKLQEGIVDKEHVYYHRRAVIIPDAHGLSKEAIFERIRAIYGEGENVEIKDDSVYVNGEEVVVYGMGDVADPDKGLMRAVLENKIWNRNIYSEALQNTDHPKHGIARKIKETPKYLEWYEALWLRGEQTDVESAIRYWIQALNEGRMCLGNHEIMYIAGMLGSDTQLFNWLIAENGGFVTFKALTGKTLFKVLEGITEKKWTGFNEQHRDALRGDPQEWTRIAVSIRQELQNSSLAQEFLDALCEKPKLYLIVNGEPITHAGFAKDGSGQLIDYERLDQLEEAIQRRDLNEIRKLAQGRSGELPVVWVKKDFYDILEDSPSAIVGPLELLAGPKGVKRMGPFLVGHNPDIGGKAVAEGKLLGCDTGNCDPVMVDLVAGGEALIQAVHNFGTGGPIRVEIK